MALVLGGRRGEMGVLGVLGAMEGGEKRVAWRFSPHPSSARRSNFRELAENQSRSHEKQGVLSARSRIGAHHSPARCRIASRRWQYHSDGDLLRRDEPLVGSDRVTNPSITIRSLARIMHVIPDVVRKSMVRLHKPDLAHSWRSTEW